MATNNSRDVKLNLAVGVTGTEDVQQLAGDLGNVAAAGTAAAPGVERLGAELATLASKTKELRAAESAARSEVALQRTARDEQRDALSRLRAETDKAARGTDEYKTKERNLALAILDSRAALRTKQSALDAATTSARIAYTEELKLTEQVRQLGAASAASARQQTAANASMGDGLDKLKGQLGDLRNIAVAALGGSYLGSLAKDVAETADAYNNLQARIKLVTGEGPAFQTAFEGVTAVAQRTSSSLESTGNLFSKLADAGRAMGVGQAEALKLTETVNQAVQLSGASAQASDAAITQLIQGLQGGVLRGDEFNSVMEQSPRLARALADGLGTTTGALRTMAEAGQLSSETVIRALQGQSDAVATEFAKLPPTVGRAIENLSTSWTLYVGETDKATGASTAAASAINALSANLKTVAGFLLDAGQAAAAFVALKLAQHFTGLGVAAAQSAVAVAANTAAITAAGTASSAAAVNVGRFAGLLSTLKTFTLLGIVTNFHDIGTAIGETAAKLMGYRDRTNEIIAADRVSAQIAAEGVAMRQRMAAALQISIDKQFELSGAAVATLGEFDKLTKSGTSAAEAVSKIGKDFDLANVPGIRDAAAVLDKLAADGRITATEFQKAWADALNGTDLAVFETQARAAFAGTAREAERLGQVLDVTLRESIKRTGLDFDVISGGMGKAARSAINDTEAMIAGLDRLKAMGVNTAQALTASIGKGIDTADSQKAIEAVRMQIEAVRKVLGDKVADGLLDQAKLKAEALTDALEKAKPGVDSLREAMKLLGVVSDETLKNTAAQSKKAFDEMRTNGTASARELSEGFKKYAADAIAANGGVASEAIKAQAAMHGLTVEVDRTGKAVIKSMGDAAEATRYLKDETLDTVEAYRKLAGAAYEATSELGKLAIARRNAAVDRGDFLVAGRATEDAKWEDKIAKGNADFADQQKRNGAAVSTPTRRSIFENAKGQGLTDAQALQLADEFLPTANQRGGIGRLNGENWGTDLQHAIDKQVLTNASKTATTGGPSSSTTVNINMGGRRTAINVASQSDANALTGLLRQLESAWGVSV